MYKSLKNITNAAFLQRVFKFIPKFDVLFVEVYNTEIIAFENYSNI